jgi:hypothetical protein
MISTRVLLVLKRGRTLNLSVECQLEVFDKMIKPILLYGSDIWGFSKNIESGKNTNTILQITIEIKIIDTQSI